MADFTENIKNRKCEIIEVLNLISNKEDFDRAQNTLYFLDFKRELLERIHGFKRQKNTPWFKHGIKKADMESVFTLFTRIENLFDKKEFEEFYLTPEYQKLKSDIDKTLPTLFV